MITTTRWLLAAAIISMLMGLLSPKLRGIAIPTGLALLVAGFLLEKLTLQSFKGKEPRGKLSNSGQMSATATSMIVTDNWSMIKSTTLSCLDGKYGIEAIIVARGKSSCVDAIRIWRLEVPNGILSIETVCLSVDSGWLMFLNGAFSKTALLNRYRREISAELATLSTEEPMCLWLDNENQVPVGIVVTTGEGNGEYEMAFTTVDGVLTELIVEFGVE